MPLSFRKFTSTGAATYPIGFNYISPDHVLVLVDGVLRSGNYTLANGNLTFTSPIPASGVELRIYRNTPGRTDATKNSVIVDFVNGATLSESDLDASVKQNFYLVQEAQDTAEGAVLSQQSVTEPMMANNAASERVIQTDAVTTNKIANLAVTNAKLAANSVSEVKIVDLSVSTRTVQNQAITEAKVDNTFLGTIVRTSGDQAVAGVKTFSSLPVIPETPTQNTHAASKQYVDIGDSGYQGNTPGETNLPIGSVVFATYFFNQFEWTTYSPVLQVNQTVKLWLHPHLTLPHNPPNIDWSVIPGSYVVTASNHSVVPQAQSPTMNYLQMAGTWKSRGHFNLSSSAVFFFLVQRIS